MSRARLSYSDREDAAFEASPVVSLLVSAQRAGTPLRHDCGGKALCGTCRVRVLSGAVSPMLERERARLEAVGFSGSICQRLWPARVRNSAKCKASGPRSPMPKREGREVRCRSTPLVRL